MNSQPKATPDAATLLVSAVGAFWAAQMGGNHRDNGTAFANVFRRV
jgi:hypothetical protein